MTIFEPTLQQDAGNYMDGLMAQMESGFTAIAPILNQDLRQLMQARLHENCGKLKVAALTYPYAAQATK